MKELSQNHRDPGQSCSPGKAVAETHEMDALNHPPATVAVVGILESLAGVLVTSGK